MSRVKLRLQFLDVKTCFFFHGMTASCAQKKGPAQRVPPTWELEFFASKTSQGRSFLIFWLAHNSENAVCSQETEHDQTGWLENLTLLDRPSLKG